MSRALVIGAGGFLGRHLADAAADAGCVVVGAGRNAGPDDWPHEWVSCDLRSDASVSGAVSGARPDLVFHVAGAPTNDFDELLAVSVAGTARLLDAVDATAGKPRVVIAGSAAEYGAVGADELPVAEAARPRPVSPYGVAKAAQTLVAMRPDADALVARVFNISGPGEPPSLATGAFASQIVELERGGRGGEIAVGDLDPERDFLDVRDAARALVAIAERGRPREAYNVCSGVATAIGDVLAMLIAEAEVPVRPRVDPARAARPGVPRMVGSAAKLTADTGWAPSISLEQTLADLLAAYRGQ
jgi:GDP-4-dehydro-6-deoxy-D-mannose reductase